MFTNAQDVGATTVASLIFAAIVDLLLLRIAFWYLYVKAMTWFDGCVYDFDNTLLFLNIKNILYIYFETQLCNRFYQTSFSLLEFLYTLLFGASLSCISQHGQNDPL